MARKADGEFPKFSENVRKKYLEQIAEGCGLWEAAFNVGVSDGLVRQYRAAHPEWREQVEEAREKADDKMVNALFQTGIKGNVTAQQVWLYNRRPDEWKDRRKPDDASGGGADSFDLSRLSNDERQAIREAVDKAFGTQAEGGPGTVRLNGVLPH